MQQGKSFTDFMKACLQHVLKVTDMTKDEDGGQHTVRKAQYKADLQQKKPQELEEEAQKHGVPYSQGALTLFPLARDELTTKLLENMDKTNPAAAMA